MSEGPYRVADFPKDDGGHLWKIMGPHMEAIAKMRNAVEQANAIYAAGVVLARERSGA